MTSIIVSKSVTPTVIIGFLQNRLRELNIADSEIEHSLHNLSREAIKVIDVHFENRDHLSSEDLYYDEVTYEYNQFILQLQSINLKHDQRRKLFFVVTKLFDQIALEARQEQIPLLADIAFESIRKILELNDATSNT
ncbi:hypothetical protein [Paraflavitalea sp. CAU 1676]|uniref:hypothetical protein n=1 Tax=Paraflavitalea sp. CAU 1676 TaxID=3032598 RepID=UPI0023DC7EA9|nr:hypothetical protein [Paraflavitalea sp. CAU 1676]MDF2188436.1 hypothetical protein [Paraflavitalea sp. CAU 1676]